MIPSKSNNSAGQSGGQNSPNPGGHPGQLSQPGGPIPPVNPTTNGPPTIGKRMRDIVPYSEKTRKFIQMYVFGGDFTNEIADEHEPGSEFVTARADEDGGQYTGWMLNGKKHGRGTLDNFRNREGFGNSRYDGMWKHGVKHGKGRLVTGDSVMAYQGTWINDSKDSEGMKFYTSSGQVAEYRNGRWKEDN